MHGNTSQHFQSVKLASHVVSIVMRPLAKVVWFPFFGLYHT